MSKQTKSSIPLPPVVQPHELQYKILRERQLLQRELEQENEPSERSRRQEGSQRSSTRKAQDNVSTRSGSNAGGAATSNRSGISISSSVALSKLNKLEDMLNEERKARQGAESMLIALQRERVAREDAVRQSENTKRQLDQLMSALRQVVQHPEEGSNIRNLQSLIDKSQVDPAVFKRLKSEALAADGSDGTARFAKNGTSLAPPLESKYTKKIAHANSLEDNTSSGRGQPKSFLDGMGHFERTRERDRKKEKASRQ